MNFNFKTKLEKYFYFFENEKQDFFLKREDQNISGSHKIRGISYQVQKEIEYFEKKNFSSNRIFTMTTSGNAGVSASFCLEKFGKDFKFIAFVPKNIDVLKVKEILDFNENSFVVISDFPKKFSLMLDKLHFAKSIRQSTSLYAIQGFESLGKEIFDDFPDVENIFLPVSSGTTLLGIHNFFKKNKKKNINFFIVQTTKIFTIAKKIKNNFDFSKKIKKENFHPANAISDMICHRKNEILEIKNLHAEIINSSDTIKSHEILKKEFNLDLSFESALTFSAWQKRNFPKNSVLISTGKNKKSENFSFSDFKNSEKNRIFNFDFSKKNLDNFIRDFYSISEKA